MSSTRRRSIWILAGAVAFTLLLYAVPYGAYVVYPLLLLSTFAHEMGHGVVALLVGGTFESFVMSPDGSGLAMLRVPEDRLAHAAVSAGGLIGPAVLGAMFFWLARKPKTARAGLLAFGLICLIALALVVRNAFGWIFVGLVGGGCAHVAANAKPRIAQIALAFMAVQLSLSVFSRADYLFTESAGAGPSDVAQIARALFLPYWAWGIACGALSVVIVFWGIRAFVGRRA